MFYEKFKFTNRIDEIIKKSEDNSKFYIDTTLINRIILNREGILEKNILDSELCTMCNSYKMHSYRQNGSLAGRNTALMALR